MTDNHTLLSFIAQRHSIGLEDVATDALFFILSHSAPARQALSDLLGYEGDPLPIAKAQPWAADAHGAVPDLACLDNDDNLVALIESKFWAPLTRNQPVTYWEGLPDDRPSVLLFLAPEPRVDQGGLWDELVERLRNACHELEPAKRKGSLITAPAKAGQRRLMLTTWQLLLDRMAQMAKDDDDTQACFEIEELQGLAASVIAGDNPQRDENLKRLIADAVRRLERSGWANTDGLAVGVGINFHVRYLRLAGANAWLGIDYEAVKQMPDKPLWLSFYGGSNADVDLDTVRSALGGLAEPDAEWRRGQVRVPIILPEGADHDATLDAIATELERIACLIHPNGPTYNERD